MFKRVVWFGTGVASGVAGSVYAQRKVKQQVVKVQEQVQEQVDKFTTADGLKAEAARQARRISEDGKTAVTRYRRQAQDKFFDKRRRDNIKPVPDP